MRRFLPACLPACLSLFLLAGMARGKQTIWVDADQVPSGNGTQASPYGTLTEALAAAVAGDTIMLEMSTAPYDDQSPNVEGFLPVGITIPAGVKIQLWDADGNVNERARFVTANSAAVCFRLEGPISAGTTQILTYLTSQPQKVPDTNQGLEIHGFDEGITIDLTGGSAPAFDVSALVDGVAFYGCRKAVILATDGGTQAITLDLTLQRFLVRVPDSSSPLSPDLPQIAFSPYTAPPSGRHDLNIELVGGDLRTVDRALQASMVLADLPRQTDISLYVQGVAIAGRPAGLLGPPPQVYPIEHCGIEVVAGKAEHQVDVQLANVEVHDAEYDGVHVRIKGDKVTQSNTFGTFVAENSCVITENGSGQPVPSGYSKSGIHLVSREGGTWTLVRISDSQVNSNVGHGLFAEGSSFSDQADKFGTIVLGKSEFRYNGQGQSGKAHGVFVKVMDYDIDSLVMHHLLLANNRTSGFRLDIETSDDRTTRSFLLRASNCVLSNNQGQGAVGQYLFAAAPLVLYGAGEVQGTIHLAQLTITDNDAPYAVAVQYEDRDPQDPGNPADDTRLWQPGSNVHNCVLNKNGPVYVGTVLSDQAFYPWPTRDAPYDLWQAMFNSTYNSNLGKLGAPKASAYTTDRQNQYGDPLLTTIAQDLGLVFPDQSQGSPLIDAGMATTVPNTSNDVRGEPRPDAQTGRKDIGAYEVQQ